MSIVPYIGAVIATKVLSAGIVIWIAFAIAMWGAIKTFWEEYKEAKEKRRKKREQKQQASINEHTPSTKMETNVNSMMGTRDLFLDTLTKCGCQYEAKENDSIFFRWQGGQFYADAVNDRPFVVVWFAYWEQFELYDIDSLARVKKVINNANTNYNLNVVYSTDDASKSFHLHSKKHFLFIPQIPNIEDYLQTILESFFHVRLYVETELERERVKEKDNG